MGTAAAPDPEGEVAADLGPDAGLPRRPTPAPGGPPPGGAEAEPPGIHPTGRLLRIEVVLVLAVSLGQSGLYAALDLIKGLVATARPLAQQTTTLYAPAAPQLWLDVSYQLLNLGSELAPVLLVVYLLVRSGESLAVLGVDASRPAEDARWSAGLALVVGAAGLGALFAAKALGINRDIIVGGGASRWWDVVLLVFQAAGTAISEEVIVGGYLLHRFRQMGWRDEKGLLVASAVRGSYHLYQGFGGAAANFVLGLFFGRVYQRRGRIIPMIVAHFLIDAIAFVGYVELKPHVSWLP